jgi:hypothetical protein
MAIDLSLSNALNSPQTTPLQPVSSSNFLQPITDFLQPVGQGEFLQPLSSIDKGSKLLSIATSFTFQELTGERRTLTLTGRALPYRPLSLSGTMRAEVTYYPGSPEPTVQMLGSTEEETTIVGMWKDRFITLDSGFALLNLVDDMRRKGQLIQISWDEIVRQGFISQFEQTWDSRRDVSWSITFRCINQGDVVPNANISAISKPDQFAATIQNALETAAQAFGADILQKFLAAVRFPRAGGNLIEKFRKIAQEASILPSVKKSSLFLLRAKDFSLRFAIEVKLARNALDNALSGVSNKAQLVEDVLSRANSVLEQSTAFARKMRSRPLEEHILNAVKGTTTFGQVLAIAASVRDLSGNMQSLAREMANVRITTKSVKKRDSAPISAPFVAKQGDDLRKVARIMMGDANAWRIIAAYNNLQTSELEPGQRVYIPNRSMVARGSNPK